MFGRARPRGSASSSAKGKGFPLDSRLFGVMGVWDFGFCLADTLRRDDRPPTHFFVKKKFIPIGGAETATQKVPSVFCYARDFL